jgi:hypothetical protein
MRVMKIFSIFLLMTVITNCTTWRLLDNWHDSDGSVSLKSLHKVLIIAYINNPPARNNTEDTLSALLNGKGIASNQYSKKDFGSVELLDRYLEREGFDGAIIIRLVPIEGGKKYIPGHKPLYYYDFGSYYHIARYGYYQSDYFKKENFYSVETNVYSFKKDRLLWSAVTEGTKGKRLIDEAATIVFAQMKKEGLITGSAEKK